MKKILICLAIFCSIFILTGCTKENVNLDLNKIETALDELKADSFDRLTAADLLSTKFTDLIDLYDFDFDKKLGLNNENVDTSDYSVALNEQTKEMYIIVKPLEGKKETVKNELDKYVETKKITEKTTFKEIDNYLIYITSENSEDLMKEIEDCKAPIFSSLMKIEDDLLENTYGIKKDMVEEYLIKVPTILVSSNTYVIVKPTTGNKEEVKEKLDTYMKNLETQWETYLPDQYELVKNRLVEEYGDYLIYIVSKDNNKVLETIKEYNK